MLKEQIKNRTILIYSLLGLLGLLLLVVMTVVLCTPSSPEQEKPTRPPVIFSPTLPPNPYTPEDFTRSEEGYLTCSNGVMGIDVSEFQGNIRWEEVKDAGVEFVFIRVGGRGYGFKGTLYEDSAAEKNYKGAKKAGLQVGVYFFSQAINPRDAVEEARYVLQRIKGWKLDLPVVFDWEYVNSSARTARVDRHRLTTITRTFCAHIAQAGFEPMVYFNMHQGANLLYLPALQDYPFWLAYYSDAPDTDYKVDYWQYSYTGKVPGIDTDVDLNLYFPN
ncbi:MAG: glycoside hydrolase family 25 protein [Oscillospiraceae bacterium]|nr:glycoside hydrolase family 25 protein [Oscillospiraceae bacterium]